MKHSLKITIFLVILFFAAQIVGLEAVKRSIDVEQFSQTGNLSYVPLAGNITRPDVAPSYSFIWIVVAIGIGTLLVLLLIRFRQQKVWKSWFFLSVLITLTFSLHAFLKNGYAALILATGLAIWKIYRPNVIVHNVTEVFIYGGLAVIFVPILNVFWGVILLLAISAYDMYAVWKSKHMVELAKFQTKNEVFAGLFVPYKKVPKPKKGQKTVKKKVRTAVLGGGDIGFPLIFTGTVMTSLIATHGIAMSFLLSLIVAICATIALLMLFLKAKKDAFYPAMPFITAGCLIGYFIVLFLQAAV